MMGNYQVRFLGEGVAATLTLLPDWGGWGETPVPTRNDDPRLRFAPQKPTSWVRGSLAVELNR